MLSFHMGKLYQPYMNVQHKVYSSSPYQMSHCLSIFFSYTKHEILKLQHDLEEAEKVSHCTASWKFYLPMVL